jgi:acyl dehydratase
MLDPSALGRTFGPYTVTVEAERLRLLGAALGDPSLAAPPTWPTCYGLWANTPLLAELAALGAPLPRLLHGEQRYSFHAPVEAGAALTAAPAITGLEQKSGRSGPFQLVTLETRWHAGDALALTDTLVVVVRGEAPAPSQPSSTVQPSPLVPHSPSPLVPPASLAPGDELPAVVIGPLTADDFVRYAHASGDHNPLHTDPAFARAAGLNSVIVHGMLVMGVMGRVTAVIAGPAAITALQTRFLATTAPGETLRCGGRVASLDTDGGRRVATLELWARGAGEQLKAAGSAAVALPERISP